jgi:hypothetical protein
MPSRIIGDLNHRDTETQRRGEEKAKRENEEKKKGIRLGGFQE